MFVFLSQFVYFYILFLKMYETNTKMSYIPTKSLYKLYEFSGIFTKVKQTRFVKIVELIVIHFSRIQIIQSNRIKHKKSKLLLFN